MSRGEARRSGAPRSRRRALSRYALFLAGWIAFVLLAAGAYYTLQFHDTFVRGDSNWPEGSYRLSESVGYEMTPGFSAPMVDGSFHVKSHRLGYRIPRLDDPTAFEPGGVLAVGCSFTYGDEVEAEEAFAHRVGESLGLPVYNFGVPSYSYASILLQLDDLDRRGVLDQLKPSLLLLGVGDWLVERSLSPLYPTTGLPWGYPFIERRDGALAVVQAPSFYSGRHYYALRHAYFPDGIVDDRLTAARFLSMFSTTPRVFAARADQKLRIGPAAARIDPSELYRLVLPAIARHAGRHAAELVVLWMPATPEATLDLALRDAVEPSHRLVDGSVALRSHGVPASEFAGHHPYRAAHRAYADAVVSLLNSAGGAR